MFTQELTRIVHKHNLDCQSLSLGMRGQNVPLSIWQEREEKLDKYLITAIKELIKKWKPEKVITAWTDEQIGWNDYDIELTRRLELEGK